MSRERTIIENVQPSVDCGRYPAKSVVGEVVTVSADIYADGHDLLRALIRYGPAGATHLRETEMRPIGNDAWTAEITMERIGRFEFEVEAWVDHYDSWMHGLRRKVEVDAETDVDMAIGAGLIAGAAERATRSADRKELEQAAALLASAGVSLRERAGRALGGRLSRLVRAYPDRSLAVRTGRYAIIVDPEHARFSAWYEMFPRSTWGGEQRHGTFRDVAERLGYIAGMGFDVLYLPPIHPIGVSYRKGRNNALVADEDDPGSPWAIGAPEGGHTEIHPRLGTADDFRALVNEAGTHGIRIALDIAFQCSPDHPWVQVHPEWFTSRPDGSIQYAENPPKKYQDIYPINFESAEWEALWQALKEVFEHWIAEGVTIFRVDNPHTKSYPFWEWCIHAIKQAHPQVIFLAEAFTRPRRM